MRTRAMSVEQILARMDDRFRLLAAREHVTEARHQTLRATVEWSFGLCAEPERTPEERARYAHASATVIVSDLDAVVAALTEAGAVITTPEAASATGRYLYARHPGGAEIEYVEWVPELVRRIVG